MAEKTDNKDSRQAVANRRRHTNKLTLDLIRSGTPSAFRELARRALEAHQQQGETLPMIRTRFLWQLHHKKDLMEVPKRIMQAAVEIAEKRLIEASDARKDLGVSLDDDNEKSESAGWLTLENKLE